MKGSEKRFAFKNPGLSAQIAIPEEVWIGMLSSRPTSLTFLSLKKKEVKPVTQ